MRRGMPYGRAYDPAHPDDGVRRGLLGNFICASLVAQFEAVMYDWINLGLQDPRITATNDPLTGANKPGTSKFVIPLAPHGGSSVELSGFGRFTKTVGGAYCFLPSMTALRFLAALDAS